MTQQYDLVENMCDLYIRVNASPNVGKFKLLQYLKQGGWHCELLSHTTSSMFNISKLIEWCAKNNGLMYHDVVNSNGTWYYFSNNTGSCTDYVFAFKHASDHQKFMDKYNQVLQQKLEKESKQKAEFWSRRNKMEKE